MRRFPSSWDKTLTALGFRRKNIRTRQKRHRRERVRLESLERRELLASDTYVVSSLDDVAVLGTTTDDQWSLREAVAHSAADANGIDEIRFASSLSDQTLSLSSQITITSDVVIDASDAPGLTLSNDSNGQRLFWVKNGGTEATFRDLRMANVTTGWSGGVIYSTGDLTVDRVKFENNSGGFTGGVIYAASGSLTVNDSEFTGNSASTYGGAIRANGLANTEIIGSTFENNETHRSDGGSGGAIHSHYGGVLRIANSTFVGNSTHFYGAAVTGFRTSSIEIENSTIVNNTVTPGRSGTGGVLLAGTTPGDGRTLSIVNSVVAGNDNNGSMEHHSGVLSNPANHNYITTDHYLGPLGDNGGPTRTMRPLPGSPLIDAGNDSLAPGLVSDQRGDNRSVNLGDLDGDGSVRDIGAVEAQAIAPIVVSALGDGEDGVYGDGSLTLREAIAAANRRSDQNEIVFSPSVLNETITLTDGPLVIEADLTIKGHHADLLTISAGGFSGVFEIRPGVQATLHGMTIRDGVANRGAGVRNEGDLTLEYVVVSNNAASEAGGGVLTEGSNASLAVVDSHITNNTANHPTNSFQGYGGGIGAEGGSLRVERSIISDNASTYYAGGIGTSAVETTVEVLDSTVANNQSTYAVGIGLVAIGSTSLTNTTVSGNQAGAGFGAGVYAYAQSGRSIKLTNVTVAYNHGGNGPGAGVYAGGPGAVQVVNSIIAENTTDTGNTYDDVSGSFDATSSHNLIGVVDGATGLTNATSTTGTHASPVAAGLAPLDVYFGTTPTHALYDGSLAIDAGSDALALNMVGTALLTDQSGATRLVDANEDGAANNIDLGAVERQTYGFALATVQTGPLIPEIDTYVDEGNPTQGFPDETFANVGFQSGNALETYFQFDLDSLSVSEVLSATAQLSVLGSAASTTHVAELVLSPWGESLDWNGRNSLSIGSSVLASWDPSITPTPTIDLGAAVDKAVHFGDLNMNGVFDANGVAWEDGDIGALHLAITNPTEYQAIYGFSVSSPEVLRAGDWDGDGLLTFSDAKAVLRRHGFAPGDANLDGEVDNSDYESWTNDFASTSEFSTDFNFDGSVDAADYTVWRDNIRAVAPDGKPIISFRVRDTGPSGTDRVVSYGTSENTDSAVRPTLVIQQAVGSTQLFMAAENLGLGGSIGTVQTNDPATSFAIVGGNVGEAFEVSATGEILVLNPEFLDYEQSPRLVLEIVATTTTGEERITADIRLLDERELPVVIADPFSAAQNASAGSVVGTVAAFDDDRDATLTYTLLTQTGPQNQGAAFALDSHTGRITVLTPEQLGVGSHTINVRVSENSPREPNGTDVALTIEVLGPGVQNVTNHPLYDYSISHNSSLSFDPRSQIENQAGRDLQVEVISGSGRYGSLTVDQATGGLLYTPVEDVLSDADWHANRSAVSWANSSSYRYAADESTLTYRIYDPADSSFGITRNVALQLTNDLPIFLGTDFQEESASLDNTTLRVRLSAEQTGLLDLREYFYDPDGDEIQFVGLFDGSNVGSFPSFTGRAISPSVSRNENGNILSASLTNELLTLSHTISPSDSNQFEEYGAFVVVVGDGQMNTGGTVDFWRGYDVVVHGYADEEVLFSENDFVVSRLAYATPTIGTSGSTQLTISESETTGNQNDDGGSGISPTAPISSADQNLAESISTSPAGFSATVSGSLDPSTDFKDVYSFFASPGDSFRIHMRGASSSSGTLADPLVVIYDPSGAVLDFDDDVSGSDFDALIEPQDFAGFSTAGTYYVVATTSPGTSDFGTYELDIEVGSGQAATAGWGLGVQTLDTGLMHEVTTSLGSGEVDLADGSLVLRHDLDLDNSPGEILPGFGDLIYDSSTVDPRPVVRGAITVPDGVVPASVNATLKWYDHLTPGQNPGGSPAFDTDRVRVIETTATFIPSSAPGGDIEFALQLPDNEELYLSGVYHWDLSVDITTASGSIQLTKGGESTVIVREKKSLSISGTDLVGGGLGFEASNGASLGNGWRLGGVPDLIIDEMGSNLLESDVLTSTGRNSDRILIHWPGQAIRQFEAVGDTYGAGLRPVRTGGVTDIREFGSLEFELGTGGGRDAFVYTAPNQTVYRFEEFEPRPGATNSIYELVSIQLTNEPLITLARTPDTIMGVATAGRLNSITMPDGAVTTFDYSVAQQVTISQAGNRDLVIELDANNQVDRIRNVDVEGATDWVREFGYTGQDLTRDARNEGAGDVRVTQFGYSSGTSSISSVTLGEGVGEETTYEVSPALASQINNVSELSVRTGNGDDFASASNAVASVTLAAGDLQSFDNQTEATVVGDFVTEYEIDRLGRLVRREELFDPTPGDSADNAYSRAKELWTYDRYDSVRTHTAANGREFAYRYDYDFLPGSSGSEVLPGISLTGDAERYAEGEYRGNLIETSDRDLRTRYLYYADGGSATQVGALRQEIDPRGVVTTHTRDGQRRLTQLTTQRLGADNYVETWTYDLPADPAGLVQTHVSPLGLTTQYQYDVNRRVTKQTVTDDQFNTGDSATSAVRVTDFAYGTGGFGEATDVVTRATDGGAIVSAVKQDYDRAGLLRLTEVFDTDAVAAVGGPITGGTVLNRVATDYRPDYLVEQTTTSITANNSRQRIDAYEYDTQGRLTAETLAQGAMFVAHAAAYANRAAAIEQQTNHTYYTTGHRKTTTAQDGTTTTFYHRPADPTAESGVNRVEWASAEGVAAGSEISGGLVSTTFVDRTSEMRYDVLGREVSSVDLLTGAGMSYGYDDRFNLPSTTTETFNTGNVNSATGQQRVATSRVVYNQIGRVVHDAPADVSATAYQYDELGYVERSEAVGVSRGGVFEYSTDPLGNVIQVVETRKTLDRFGSADVDFTPLTQTFTTLHQYDERGRLRKAVDADGFANGATLASSDDTIGVSTITYSFGQSAAGGLNRSVTTTNDRDKLDLASPVRYQTKQYSDGAGRLTETEGPLLGERMTYEYNLDDTLIRERYFVRGSDSSEDRDMTYAYDDLGRQRSETYVGGGSSGRTFTTFTDYFEPDNTAEGDPNSPDLVVSTELDDNTERVEVATFDSLGSSILRYDTSDSLEAGPHTLSSYAYDPANRLITTTIRTSLGTDGTFDSTPDELAKAEVFRQVASTQGATLSAAELRDPSPNAVINDAALADAVFEVRQRSEVDAIGRQRVTLDTENAEADGLSEAKRRAFFEYDDHDTGVGALAVQALANDDRYQIEYDSSGNAVSVRDQEGSLTATAYDGIHRPLSERVLTDATSDNETRTWQYNGLETVYTDRSGYVVTTSLNPSTNVETVGVTGTTAQGEAYSYSETRNLNADGTINSLSNQTFIGGVPHNASTIAYQYDEHGRVTEITQQHTFGSVGSLASAPETVQTFTYHDNHRRATAELRVNGTLTSTKTYGLDGLGRLTSIAETFATSTPFSGDAPNARTVGIAYDGANRRELITRAEAGLAIGTTDYGYRSDGRLESITHTDSTTANELLKLDFTYDADGRILTREITRDLGVALSGTDLLERFRRETYQYDRYDQLTDVRVDSGATAVSNDALAGEAYRYDDAGNRTADNNTASYDAGLDNRLLSDDRWTYTYDDQGRLASRAGVGALAGISEAYTYDHRGLLLGLTRTAGVDTLELIYAYDGEGRLVGERILDNSVTIKDELTHWDGRDRLAEFNSSGEITRYYLSSTLGSNEVLAVDQNGQTAWALHDQIGSVLAWGEYDANPLDSPEWEVQHLRFDTFGQLEATSASLNLGALPVIWAGHQLDEVSGFYHAQWRWYDAMSGRFLSQDPAKADRNDYRYAGNNAANSVDPLGLEHLPADSRGQWVEGSRGNGVFQYSHSEQNKKAGLAGKKVRFRHQHIAIGGFPAAWYYGGKASTATVTIDKVEGTTADFDAADEKMRKKTNNPEWKRPRGYTWNHAGTSKSRKMELVKTKYHSRVAHQGSAALPRALAKARAPIARANAAFQVYDILKDATIRTTGDIGPSTVINAPYYFYEESTDSVFIVEEGAWHNMYTRKKSYIAGSMEGTKAIISEEQFDEYVTDARKRFGTLRWYPFSGYYFDPGTEKSSIPVIDEYGREIGCVDEEGEHIHGPHPWDLPGA